MVFHVFPVFEKWVIWSSLEQERGAQKVADLKGVGRVGCEIGGRWYWQSNKMRDIWDFLVVYCWFSWTRCRSRYWYLLGWPVDKWDFVLHSFIAEKQLHRLQCSLSHLADEASRGGSGWVFTNVPCKIYLNLFDIVWPIGLEELYLFEIKHRKTMTRRQTLLPTQQCFQKLQSAVVGCFQRAFAWYGEKWYVRELWRVDWWWVIAGHGFGPNSTGVFVLTLVRNLESMLLGLILMHLGVHTGTLRF